MSASALVGYTPTGQPNVSWLPAMGLFAYTSDNAAVLEDLTTRAQRRLVGCAGDLACLAASPSGDVIAVGAACHEKGQDGFASIFLWDVARGALRKVLRYHPLGVQLLAFSACGRWLASVGQDPERSVVLWEVASGALVAAGRTEQSVYALQWLGSDGAGASGDVARFMSAGGDGLLMWSLMDRWERGAVTAC